MGRWSIPWNLYCSRVEEQRNNFVWADGASWELRSLGPSREKKDAYDAIRSDTCGCLKAT